MCVIFQSRNVKYLSIFSAVHEISRTFVEMLTPNPRGGVGQKKISGQFMTFPGLLIFLPPKIPTATPFGGGGGGGDFFFAFKDTISRHFASYASVALETIWLHEPRDVIFLGPLMTLLCLSRYSGMGEVLFTHADCRRM